LSRTTAARLLVAAAALALLILPTVRAGASTGTIGLQLLDVPTTARLDPRARLYIVDHLAPGTTIHRRIGVSNTTPSTIHIALYPAAASIGKGVFTGAAGHTRNELTTWTSVSPGALEVRPGAHRVAVVTIAVPHDAAPGERYGAVWAEARSSPTTAGGITEVSRVGVRLYLSVGPGGPPAANFTINSLVAKRSRDGRPLVLATVHNTGGRALDMNGTLRLLHGPGGLRAGPFPANLGVTLGIGETEAVTIPLDPQLPAGPWNARVTLRSGLLQRSNQTTLTFPATKTPSHAIVLLGALAAALLMLGIVGVLVARRGPRRLVARHARSRS
jgi:hypothetical protein